MTELKAVYANQKSFYGKAVIAFNGDAVELYSYNTLVAKIEDDTPVLYGRYSQTTTKHQKEFLMQHGYRFENNNQMFKEFLKD